MLTPTPTPDPFTTYLAAIEAAHLLGNDTEHTHRPAFKHLLQAADLSDYERNLATARSQLGETTFKSALAIGRTTPFPEAIAGALE